MNVLCTSSIWVVLSFAMIFSASAATNEWTKTTSGNWEEAFWSLGTLPGPGQEAVAFRNPGWKALAIGPNTAANHANSLTVNNLTIDAPTNSSNQLLLNWAGHEAPLVVRSNLIVGTNGSIACHSSTLMATNILLNGPVTFSDNSRATLERITLKRDGLLNIHDVYLSSSNLLFLSSGTVTQTAGIAVISRIRTDGEHDQRGGFIGGPPAAYHLLNGVLITGVADIGDYDLTDVVNCTIFQSGGVHTNDTMTLWGGQRHFQQITRVGHYVLYSGQLVSRQTTVFGGTMEQSGGTNLTRDLVIAAGGYYTLNAGQLVTSNTTVGTVDCLSFMFYHNGGSHTVQNRFALNDNTHYLMAAGTLSAPLIELYTGAELVMAGGTVANSGMVVLHRGEMRVENSPPPLGKLQVLDSTGFTCGGDPNRTASITMGSANAPVVLRFQDSRNIPWSRTLRILNWTTSNSGNGPDRLFVGTTDQGLTSVQLRLIAFINPEGFPPGSYPSRILPNGEIVPHIPPALAFSRTSSSLVLSWTGNHQLWTTTNLLSAWTLVPGAASPYTNGFLGPQRYFQLRVPNP